MKLDLKLSYRKLAGDSDTKPEDITRMLIVNSVQNKFPQTMDRDASRIWAKIMDRLLNDTEIDLDATEFEWLKDKIDNSQHAAMFSSYLWTLREHLDNKAKQS